MSEYGDIGFLPDLTTPQSCYSAAADCQLAVLIVGKRYGTASEGGISVTHKEFLSIKEAKIPLITLIDKETWTFKSVFDANGQLPTTSFPGMDNPVGTFGLIKEIITSPTNNGIIPFEHVSDARDNFRKQLAHIFGSFLRGQSGPAKEDIKDILSEVLALRQDLTKQTNQIVNTDQRNTRIIRFLVEDRAKDYRQILERLFGTLDSAVHAIADTSSFLGVIAKAGYTHEIIVGTIDFAPKIASNELITASNAMAWDVQGPKADGGIASWGILRDKKMILNATALAKFDTLQTMITLIAKNAQ